MNKIAKCVCCLGLLTVVSCRSTSIPLANGYHFSSRAESRGLARLRLTRQAHDQTQFLADAMVEDGEIQVITPTIVNWGCVVRHESDTFRVVNVMAVGDRLPLWYAFLDRYKAPVVWRAGDTNEMSFAELAKFTEQARPHYQKQWWYPEGRGLNRILVFVDLPFSAERFREFLPELCELADGELAILPSEQLAHFQDFFLTEEETKALLEGWLEQSPAGDSKTRAEGAASGTPEE